MPALERAFDAPRRARRHARPRARARGVCRALARANVRTNASTRDGVTTTTTARGRATTRDVRARASTRLDAWDPDVDATPDDDAVTAMFDDDCDSLEEALERDAARASWLRVAERASTIGAVVAGVASVVTSEVALGGVAGALPIAGAIARRARRRCAERARETVRERRREETLALRAKAARSVTIEESAKRMAPAAARAVRQDVAPVLMELAERLAQVERAQVEAAKTAAKTARDSGAVAGMLARDVAAARVDAREGIASVREEFRSTAAAATSELKRELTMLWELVETVEKDAAALREPMEALAEEIRGVVDGAVREIVASASVADGSAAGGRLTEDEMAALRADVAEAASAKVREAVERALQSTPIAVSDSAAAVQLASTLDDSQWNAMIGRLSAIEAGVNEAIIRTGVNDGVIVEEDLEDLRVEITREISADIRGIVDSVADLKSAFTSSKENWDVSGSGSAEAAAAVKQWAESKVKAEMPSNKVEDQMRWQAAIVQEENSSTDELVWVGEPSRSEPTAKTMNADATREEAFANMQALLNSKAPTGSGTEEPKTPSVSAGLSGETAERQTGEEEEVWDPFLRAADPENVAKYEAEMRAAEAANDVAATRDEPKDEFDTYSERGLESLRAGRDLARRGGKDVDMLEDADERFAEAIKDFERAASAAEPAAASRAAGNLGNAYLARGRVQAVLADMAFKEAQLARDRRVNAGLEGTGEMYFELAEENLIQAGRRFRAVVTEESDSTSESSDEKKSGITAKAKALAGWGTALSLRSELVLSTQGATADAESLAMAAAEKFRAAADIEPESPKIYTSWGDALRLGASLGPARDEDERLQQARGCYAEALRLAPEYAPAIAALDAMT